MSVRSIWSYTGTICFTAFIISFFLQDPGVTLNHRGSEIKNGSVLSIDYIGEGDSAILCKTTNKSCCRNPFRGEWYYPNGTLVPVSGRREHFYRTRSSSGEVLLHQRADRMQSIITGIYCCEIPDSIDNCGINQTLCINLGMFYISVHTLALISVPLPHTASLATITSSGSNTAGEVYRLHCTAAIGSETASAPTIIWSGPNGTIDPMSTFRGVMLEETNTSDSFTRTLKFAPLEKLHEGNYTCRVHFEGNDESSSFYTDVTGKLDIK